MMAGELTFRPERPASPIPCHFDRSVRRGARGVEKPAVAFASIFSLAVASEIGLGFSPDNHGYESCPALAAGTILPGAKAQSFFCRLRGGPKVPPYLRSKSKTTFSACVLLLAASIAGFAQTTAQKPGEQPRQLAQPNGPPQPDPNQNPQAAPGASDAGAGKHEAQDQAPTAAPPSNWAAPLGSYAGTWIVRPDHNDHPQVDTDTCQASGARFYECEHVVDGETIALLIFVPGDEPGHFYTQSVLPSGTALGRGDLAINGDTWVFNSRTQREDGSIKYQRTTRVFSGRDKDTIHYQTERSDDGLHWVTSSTGVERRKK
jgi:hypothetical protein